MRSLAKTRTRIIIFSAVLLGLITISFTGFRSYQNAQILKSVVFQDSESKEFSVALAAHSMEDLSQRLLDADPQADARRAYSVGDRRLAGIAGHYGAEVPELEPMFAVTRHSIRKKLLVFPQDEKLHARARLYCAEYNAVILRKVTGASQPE